jgi:hypothetical protein
MVLLMTFLENKFKHFGDVGGSNSNVGPDEKLGNSEDPENKFKKRPKKEKPSSCTITPSLNLFKIEEKVDIKPYQGEIDVVKYNWFQ